MSRATTWAKSVLRSRAATRSATTMKRPSRTDVMTPPSMNTPKSWSTVHLSAMYPWATSVRCAGMASIISPVTRMRSRFMPELISSVQHPAAM